MGGEDGALPACAACLQDGAQCWLVCQGVQRVSIQHQLWGECQCLGKPGGYGRAATTAANYCGMCQVGVVALGIYLLSREVEPEEIPRWTTMFADATVEFCRPVLPGERVTIRGTREVWRRRKLRSRIEMYNEEGVLVASATASGMGVRHE